jgi:glucose/arabinose dehydrogenase
MQDSADHAAGSSISLRTIEGVRKGPIVVLLGAAVAFGWAADAEPGRAPQPLQVSEPRPVATTAAPLEYVEGRLPDFEAVLVVEGLDRPTFVTPLGDDRYVITEKSGRLKLLAGSIIAPELFLDLYDAVPHRRPERGLVGMALHPDFDENRRFYLQTTDGRGDSQIIEYRVSAEDPNIADPASARLILKVEQPGEFHNGGMLQFGPDGYLYAGFGDGDFGDSSRNGALRQNMLGTILRIDVDAGDPYAVPLDNPYVGTGSAPEIWMSGFRNPWRFFIDPQTRLVVIGDVGQFRWEEIQVVALDDAGLDFGWPVLEGRQCYEADVCDADGFVLPDVVYSHGQGCAMVAGPIYRGSRIPELVGRIVYADYCTGRVSSYALDGSRVIDHQPLIAEATYGPILSLAVDEDDEILILTEGGQIRRLQPVAG